MHLSARLCTPEQTFEHMLISNICKHVHPWDRFVSPRSPTLVQPWRFSSIKCLECLPKCSKLLSVRSLQPLRYRLCNNGQPCTKDSMPLSVIRLQSDKSIQHNVESPHPNAFKPSSVMPAPQQ
jgi:hypothetical protein